MGKADPSAPERSASELVAEYQRRYQKRRDEKRSYNYCAGCVLTVFLLLAAAVVFWGTPTAVRGASSPERALAAPLRSTDGGGPTRACRPAGGVGSVPTAGRGMGHVALRLVGGSLWRDGAVASEICSPRGGDIGWGAVTTVPVHPLYDIATQHSTTQTPFVHRSNPSCGCQTLLREFG
jgi:hypothetical protein